jgi:choice-of-anchor B domain-containing protein
VLVAAAVPAAAQTSSDVSLLSHQQLYSSYSAGWGYTDPGGRELALVGAVGGTSIVDVTTPTSPVQVAFIAGLSSSWREMKTYSHYAYIVTEATGGGMQIVDLAPATPVLIKTYTTNFNRAHSITISNGYVYANGSNFNNTFRGVRILSLADPVNPVEVGAYTQFYVHDCAVRNDTMYASCINDGLISIVNVANKAVPVPITSFSWAGNFPHNCDLTTNGRYLLTTDENTGGHLHVWDLSNLGNIHLVGEWTANPTAIIHNVHVQGNLAYISYYTEGIRVVDVSNPLYPVELGYYDTWPGASGGFNGAWEVYPYAASGNAYIIDINTGLYVVRFNQTSGSVDGLVRETGSGTPLGGASLKLLAGNSGQSIGSGYYKLIGTPGTRTLVTSLFGFASDTTSVSLVMSSNTTHDVQLARLPNSPLIGSVTNATTSAPLGSASLSLGGTLLVSQSSAGGNYTFGHVPYGVYLLTASRFGFAPATRSVSISRSDPVDSLRYDFALTPAALQADFEAGPSGWSVVSPSDSALTGRWIWADPIGSGSGGVQPEDDHTLDPGHVCWVTANASSPTDAIGTADVDGGRTILVTPPFDLSAVSKPRIAYWRWYVNDAGSAPNADTLSVDVSNNGGASWKKVERIVQTPHLAGIAGGIWVLADFAVADYLPATSQMRVRFIAADQGAGSVVEAAIDDFMAYEGPAVTAAPSRTPANRLHANVPNPFNPSTRIAFELASPGPARLAVFDARGRLVRSLARGWLAAGAHERVWDGRDESGHAVASGVYLYRLDAPGFEAARRMLLVK